MNDLSSLQQLLIQVLFLTGTGIFVYLMTRWLKFRYVPWPYPDPRQSAWVAIVTAVIPLLLITLVSLATASRSSGTNMEAEIRHSPGGVIAQLIVYSILFSPVLIAMKIRSESWQSAGVTKYNLGKSILLGCLLGMITIAGCGGCLTGMLAGFSLSHFWAFLHFSVIGWGEEFAFRGYLQTRLCAWLGRWQGWFVTSVLMALIHISGRILVSGLDLDRALLSSAYLIPISLLMGYVFLRTENIAAPAIFHTFTDWVGIFV